MSVNLKGQQQWEGFHVLCRPLELFGIDRRLVGLNIVVFGVFWQGISGFQVAAVVSVVLFLVFRRLTRRDPHFFQVLRLSSRFDVAWCDPGRPPNAYGSYVLDVSVEDLDPNLRASEED